MKLLAIFLMSITLIACAGQNPYGPSSQNYTDNETNQRMQITYGTIVDLQAVQIDSDSNTIGKIAGGLLGGLAGSGIGGGRGSSAAAVAGAVVGGIIGNKAEAMYNKANGVQITIQLTDGQLQSIVQETNPNVLFHKGDHVKIVSDSTGKTRVIQ